MKRTAIISGVVLLIVGVLLQTQVASNGPAGTYFGSWAIVIIALVDVVLLAICAGFSLETQFHKAELVLLGECVLNVANTLSHTLREGTSYFEAGFGSSQYVSLYLFLILVRFLLLGFLLQASRNLARSS